MVARAPAARGYTAPTADGYAPSLDDHVLNSYLQYTESYSPTLSLSFHDAPALVVSTLRGKVVGLMACSTANLLRPTLYQTVRRKR
jgi:hypothetical protein